MLCNPSIKEQSTGLSNGVEPGVTITEMTSENVLRVELDEKSNESSHVLVHVVSSGSLARDLELEATEGTMPFYAKSPPPCPGVSAPS